MDRDQHGRRCATPSFVWTPLPVTLAGPTSRMTGPWLIWTFIILKSAHIRFILRGERRTDGRGGDWQRTFRVIEVCVCVCEALSWILFKLLTFRRQPSDRWDRSLWFGNEPAGIWGSDRRPRCHQGNGLHRRLRSGAEGPTLPHSEPLHFTIDRFNQIKFAIWFDHWSS